MIVGGCGLWLDELRLSGAQLKPGPALLDAGLLLQALPALIFYKLWSTGRFEHKKLFNICLQWQLLKRLNSAQNTKWKAEVY